jgi:hypothetical protein
MEPADLTVRYLFLENKLFSKNHVSAFCTKMYLDDGYFQLMFALIDLATSFARSFLTIINHQEMGFAFVGNRPLIWLGCLSSLANRLVLCCCERKLPTCFQQRDKALSFQGYLNLTCH